MSTGPIVVGTDGATRANLAVDRAGELGRALGAEVHVVCAPSHLGGQDWPPRITAQQVVAEAEQRLRDEGVDVHTHIPKGDAALALAAVAEHVQAKLIVVGNRGMTGIGRFLGSLPDHVSHQARCDVMIVPTQARELAAFRGRPLVAGLDSPAVVPMVAEQAIRLARALGGELHIVSTSREADATLASVAAQAAEQGVDALTHTPTGGPTDAILSVAQANDAAIIVVGGKGMHAEDRERFGNVADKLSHDGSFSVLVVFATAGEDSTQAGAVAAGAPAAP